MMEAAAEGSSDGDGDLLGGGAAETVTLRSSVSPPVDPLARRLAPIDVTHFLRSSEFSDVTLVASDGQVQAHRLILGACCPLFRDALEALQEGPDQSSVVLLPDLSVTQVETMLRLFYGATEGFHDTDAGIVDEMKNLVIALCGGTQKGRRTSSLAPFFVKADLEADADQGARRGRGGRGRGGRGRGRRRGAGAAAPVRGKRRRRTSDSMESESNSDGEESDLEWRPDKDWYRVAEEEEEAAREELEDQEGFSMEEEVESDLDWSGEEDATKGEVKQENFEAFEPDFNPSNAEATTDFADGIERRPRKRARKELKRDPDDPDLMLCPFSDCEFKDSSRRSIHVHVNKEHRKSKCPHCNRFFNSYKLEEHISRVHTGEKSASCDTCGEAFFSSHELRKHQAREGHLPDGDNTTMCRHCGLIFRTPERFRHHEQRCRAKKRGLEYRPRNKDPTAEHFVAHPSDPLRCSQCEFVADKIAKIKKHFREYHYRPLCPYCGRPYSYYFLDRHIRTMHTGELQFQCEQCSMCFYGERQLKHHIDEAHVKELKYVCDVCGQAFFSQGLLTRHKTKKHNVSRHFPCNLCSKVYLNNSSLKKHRIRHHPGHPAHQHKPSNQGRKPKDPKSREAYGSEVPPAEAGDPKESNSSKCEELQESTEADVNADAQEQQHEPLQAPMTSLSIPVPPKRSTSSSDRASAVTAGAGAASVDVASPLPPQLPPSASLCSAVPFGHDAAASAAVAAAAVNPSFMMMPHTANVAAPPVGQVPSATAAAASNIPFLQQQLLSGAYHLKQEYQMP